MENVRLHCLWLCASILTLGSATVLEGETADNVVEMAPFTVTESRWGPSWRYAVIPGYEILTQANDEDTALVVGAIFRGRRLTLPPAMRPTYSLPMAILIFDQRPDSAKAQKLERIRGEGDRYAHFENIIKRMTSDREVFAINLWGGNLRYTSAFRLEMRTLLDGVRPATPRWLRSALWGADGIYDEDVRYRIGDRAVSLFPAKWPISEDREKLAALRAIVAAEKKRTTRPQQGMPSPVSGLIAPLGAILENDRAYSLREEATLALWARWALFSENGRWFHAFWNFAQESACTPANEAMFRRYFSMSYEEVESELCWFLPLAIAQRAIYAVDPPVVPRYELRAADAAQIARVRGEWELAEARALQAAEPALGDRYRKAAERTLRRGYERDPADSVLVSTLALYEYEFGDPANALQLATGLDATKRRSALNRAFVRATLNRAKSEAERPPLSERDIAAVFAALREARLQQPAVLETYELALATWEAAGLRPSREDLAICFEAQRLFPRASSFLKQAAELHARWGYSREAEQLQNLAARFDPTPLR
ncbi:MAG: hypothetical protein KF715_02465 [Candidatus Didemnitutus sp.]|nr:hypothetical protein [Candidatus Didemnitutus sp.]